jgi:hypothetical protein
MVAVHGRANLNKICFPPRVQKSCHAGSYKNTQFPKQTKRHSTGNRDNIGSSMDLFAILKRTVRSDAFQIHLLGLV